MKAATSTTRNKSSNNKDDDESREDTYDDESNSVEAGAAVTSNARGKSKRNGKASSTDAGASGKKT